MGAAFAMSSGTHVLMPGPLSSAHGAIETCGTCHTKSGDGKLSWLHGLIAGDPRADSKACLTCHRMPDTAYNPHSAAESVLRASTERLTKIAASIPEPLSGLAQSLAFPTQDMTMHGLTCATCHQEHQGTSFGLDRVSNEQCRACHVVRFDSFDGDHPKFESYPFEQRTRIIYDHAGHFDKHYPEAASKEPSKQIPATCSTCHDGQGDSRTMSVASFDRTCASCHLDQIAGKTRASGPKGIAFLSLPGLDLETLTARKAAIGDWPVASEATLTPFMRAMIGRTSKGESVLKALEGVDLRDLSAANESQIAAVKDLAWEVKGLFHALIKGKSSDVLGDLNIARGAKLSAGLVADLTANIPRDVIIGAQQEWLPGLATEMGGGPASQRDEAVSSEETAPPPANPAGEDATVASGPESPAPDESDATAASSETAETAAPPRKAKRDPPPCLVNVLGSCLVYKDESTTASAEQRTEPGAPSTNLQPPPMQLGAADRNDELLFPSPEEQKEIEAHNKRSGKAAPRPAATGPATPSSVTGTPTVQTPRAKQDLVIAIESDVDPESWADFGGWYRQDHTIFYRPTGHKDKLLYSWLFLTGPQARADSKSPASAVFASLTGKDSQGACTKCHSVDDLPDRGRAVNFAPLKSAMKQGRFTRFRHEPHFGVMENRGCLACHNLEKGRPYFKSYEHGDPKRFASEFGTIKKDLCQSCHTASKARQDCQLCHTYHVNGVETPVMTTKLPGR